MLIEEQNNPNQSSLLLCPNDFLNSSKSNEGPNVNTKKANLNKIGAQSVEFLYDQRHSLDLT